MFDVSGKINDVIVFWAKANIKNIQKYLFIFFCYINVNEFSILSTADKLRIMAASQNNLIFFLH